MRESDEDIQAPGSGGQDQDDDSSSTTRRQKPGLAIYRPGSGPLRRTNPNLGRNSEASDKCSSSSDRDAVPSAASYGEGKTCPPSKVRNRKPQQEFYVPKPLAERLNKKYQDGKGRSLSQADLNKTQHSDSYRKVRQGSEPRIIPSRHPLDRITPVHPNDRRMRDSRSVEPLDLPRSKDPNARESRPLVSRSSSVVDKSSLSATIVRPEEHSNFASTQAADEWDGNTLTFVGRRRVNVLTDPEPLHLASDIVVHLDKSKQTEGTEHQALASAFDRVALTDGIRKEGENVPQPSPPNGGRGLSSGRLPIVNGVGRSRGRLQVGDLNTQICLPGGLRRHSGPDSSPSACDGTIAEVSPVNTFPDENNKLSSINRVEKTTVSGYRDDDSDLSKPLDWSEEVEKALSRAADREETRSLTSEKVTSGSTSSHDGRRRRRRIRQGHERSKDGAHAYRSSSNDRSSCSSARFGRRCSSEENWYDPAANDKPADVLNPVQTAFGLKQLGSGSGEGEFSHSKKHNVESGVDWSRTTSDERSKHSLKSIGVSKHKRDNDDLRNVPNRACVTESHYGSSLKGSRNASQEKVCSGNNKIHRASSGDRYGAASGDGYHSGDSGRYRAGSGDRFSRGGDGDDGYRLANSKNRLGRLYMWDRFQHPGSRDHFNRFSDRDKYSRVDSVSHWNRGVLKQSLSESERMISRGSSYSRERCNHSGSRERQLYNPYKDRFSRGMDSAGRYKPDSGTIASRRARDLEPTAGSVNTGDSIRSCSRDQYKGTSRYPSTSSLDISCSKRRTDVEPPEKGDVHVSKLEHACERPESGKCDKESFLEVPRIRDEHKDDKAEGQKESLVTHSSCEEVNNAKSVFQSSSESTTSMSRSGIIILPSEVEERFNETSKGSIENLTKPVVKEVASHALVQKHLYDPNNPNTPIPVVASGSRVCRSESNQEIPPAYPGPDVSCTNYSTEMASCWNLRDNTTIPAWLDSNYPRPRAINAPQLIADTDSVVRELLWFIHNGSLTRDWKHILVLRAMLENLLGKFLKTDLRFCARENVEKYLWNISTHKLIEKLRELMNCDPNHKEEYKAKMLTLIESDTEHLEKLVRELEEVYHFQIETFLTSPVAVEKRDGIVGLALISVQKIFLFLGDLARYKEEVNDSSNYGKCRQWYLKAHLINPRNGLPYNQLAVIAVLARRKLDAVYYYMRSIMASNTVITAREKIVILFDEARRKYEMLERKRREENPPSDDLKEKESRMGLQREFWIHPQAGVPRLHITTSTVPELLRDIYRQEDELRKLDSVELNKRFIISYINVQGKLYTKVGMESFQEAVTYMLLEFRALIQHRPLPLNVLRFLQLLALNMFSLHTSRLRQTHDEKYRPVFQENALIVALQMFNLMLERCNSLLRDHLDSGEHLRYLVPEDLITLLPAVKVWCDWMLCHVKTWNPPPSCSDFNVGPSEDIWERFATFINLLEQIQIPGGLLLETPVEGCDIVKLPEDRTLCHFLPLFGKTDEEVCYAKDDDMEVAYVALRIRKIMFFGTVFLCGIEPPVLKLHHSSHDSSKYISVVQSRLRVCDLQSTSDIRLESFSEDEDEVEVNPEEAERRANIVREALKHEGGETLTLLRRREELERDLERHKIIVQEVLKNSQVFIEIDVKPRILIPDTNTFIDHLPALRKILDISNGSEYYYSFAVPLVVFRELEGLSLGGRFCDFVQPEKLEHMEFVAEAARDALLFLRSKHPRVRCFTTRGTMIPISSCVMNEDNDEFSCNDDRILATAISLIVTSDGNEGCEGHFEETCHPRRVFREVVLLTEDRCLRMKAMTKLVPTRNIPDFIKWAGLR